MPAAEFPAWLATYTATLDTRRLALPTPGVPGATVPGATVPGATVPGPTVPGPTVPAPAGPGRRRRVHAA
jgi:hypothetical protein